MTMLECLSLLLLPQHSEMWMRPKRWKGCKMAYCLSFDKLNTELVPGRRGGEAAMTCCVYSLLEEWEIVSPDTVLNGE